MEKNFCSDRTISREHLREGATWKKHLDERSARTLKKARRQAYYMVEQKRGCWKLDQGAQGRILGNDARESQADEHFLESRQLRGFIHTDLN